MLPTLPLQCLFLNYYLRLFNRSYRFGLETKWQIFTIPVTCNRQIYFVLDEDISTAITDTANNKNRYGVDAGENLRAEFGASMVAALNTPIGKNTSFSSKLVLFNNYTDPIAEHKGNIDVDFQNNINIKVSKYFATTIFLQVLYDHDIAIATYEDGVQVGTGPKTQFKEVFGIGLSYSFQ